MTTENTMDAYTEYVVSAVKEVIISAVARDVRTVEVDFFQRLGSDGLGQVSIKVTR